MPGIRSLPYLHSTPKEAFSLELPRLLLLADWKSSIGLPEGSSRKHFRPAGTRNEVIAEVELSLAQASHLYLKIVHINNDTVPAAGFRLAPVLHEFSRAFGAKRRAQY